MLIDGEKWACEACVRGHRVSSCHHSDRTLIHVNKKGRPVSQCPHCRGLRKSRTTHAKCDCGDKKKDHHGVDGNTATGENGEAKCRCIHGQRCSCALKKEHLDTVPETGLPPLLAHNAVAEIRKPRLTSTKSESTLTVFRDGHHKPMHKHNDMAHKCGLPYTIPRSHTIHGTSELAQRSADHLPLNLNQGALDAPFFHPGADLDGFPSRRRVKSEHGSPEFVAIPLPEQSGSEVTPLDLTPLSALDAGNTIEPLNSYILQDPYQDGWLASPDTDFPISAGFNAPPVDWSSFPLPTAGLSTSVSQAPSYASFDLNNVSSNPSYPGLTGSSSGEASEVEEVGPKAGLATANSNHSNDLYDLHSLSDGSDVDQYRISSASSFAGLPQARLLSSHNLESINIDDFLRSANESTAALEQQLQASMAMESKGISASPQGYAISQSQPSYPSSTEAVSLDANQSSMNDMLWASGLFSNTLPPSMPATTSTADEDPFSQPPWAN